MTNTTYWQGWHTLRKRKWLSRKTDVTEGSIRELLQKVPHFKKVPCAIEGEGVNPHMNMIVRDRIKPHSNALLPDTDHVQVPVSTVSQKYQLVQHQELLNALACVMKDNGFDLSRLSAELCLTEFGERMWFSFTLPGDIFKLPTNTLFDPGDKHPLNLTVNALNSVDKTAALEINLYWYRLICGNGMVYGDNIKFKEIHRTDSLDPDAIRTFLQNQLAVSQVEKEKERLIRWYETKVFRRLSESKPNRGQVEQWLEKDVSKTWGIHAAARAYHIAKTGVDGKFTNRTEKEKNVKYNDLTLDPKTSTQVPAAFAPVQNAYHISQVLSWLASQQNTVQKQLKWMTDIPKLMRALLTAETITLAVDE
ncbi:MAG: DUF932 domain-containing protein [Candidatus Poribacteria bacterium]|nr:DUF932 domain-containing protein [Candidatus Poribacteria bacterium]